MPGRERGADQLYGRDHERQVVDQALGQVMCGRGQALVIRGPAGIGKTALLALASVEAAALGMRVLTSRGDPLEQEFPWEGVRRLFKPGKGADDGAVLEPGQTPDDRGVLAAPVGASLVAGMHRLYWLAVELAQEQPLLVVIDDAHWLDQLSLRWLAYTADRLEDEPILLAAAARPGDLRDEVGAWAAFLSIAVRLDLGPLDEPSTRQLLRLRMGREPDAPFTAACRRQTGGNPFLISELASAVRAARTPADASGLAALSGAERATAPNVALRLSRLGRDSQLAVHALALLGPQATVARAAALCGYGSERAAHAFGRLSEDGFVRFEPALDFVHPLLRTAAYEDMPVPRRAQWHLEAARVLHAAAAEPDVWASHLLRAPGAGDAWVVDRLREAAEHAVAQAAPETAALYLHRALVEPPGRDEHVHVLLALGRVEAATDPASASGRYRRALTLAVAWPERAQARIGLADALSYAGNFMEAADVLEAGLEELPRSEAVLRDELLAALLNSARWDLNTRPRCQPHLEELWVRLRDGAWLSPRLRANVAIELLSDGKDREGTIRQATAAIDALAGAGLESVMWIPLLRTPLACAGLLNRTLTDNERHVELIRERGWTTALGIALAGNARLQMWRGDITSALMDAEEALANTEDPISTAFAVGFLMEAYRLRDDCDAAWRLLGEHGFTRELPTMWPFPQLMGDRALLRRDRTNDLAGALDDLLTCGAFIQSVGLRCPAVVPWRSRAARILHTLGERERALQLATAELQDARAWGEARSVGASLRALAVVLGGEKQLTLLRKALAVLEPSEGRLELTETLVDLGVCLRHAGRRREAQEPLRRALQMADEGGAFALRRRAREELAVAGARPRRAAVQGRNALTSSELRVAKLASEGRSNPEIAKLLFVTRRTVETHLTQSYSKLGIRSRAELAAALNPRVQGPRAPVSP